MTNFTRLFLNLTGTPLALSANDKRCSHGELCQLLINFISNGFHSSPMFQRQLKVNYGDLRVSYNDFTALNSSSKILEIIEKDIVQTALVQNSNNLVLNSELAELTSLLTHFRFRKMLVVGS